MGIQEIRKEFTNKNELSQNELLILHEDFINAVSEKGKFDTIKEFYNYKNYKKLIDTLVSNNYCKVSDFILPKLEKVHFIETKLLNRKKAVTMFIALFLIISGIIINQVTDENNANSFADTSKILIFFLGIFFLLRAVQDYEL